MGERRQSVSRWELSPWRSKRSFWGVEVRWRKPWKHSQLRLHVGHRHLTVRNILEVRS